jgi:tRNA(Ile)-lysidine synthase
MKLAPIAAYPASAATDALEQWSRTTTTMRGAVAVAFSGGADSTCLLFEEARLRLALMTTGPEGRDGSVLHALHVNHGLQEAADGFEAHVREVGAALHLQLRTQVSVRRVQVDLPKGASMEAQARASRYDALADMAKELGVGTVLLAQHADDQVESMLLAMGRGGGVAGIAGMAPSFDHQGVHFARPLLSVSGAAIREWISSHGIPVIQDPTNQDERHPRNRIRRWVLPALEVALPQFRTTFARSAQLAAQAQATIDEVAAADLAHVGVPPSIRHLLALGPRRQAEALRHWLRRDHHTTPTQAQLLELINLLSHCRTPAHGIHVRVGRGHVHRHGEHIEFKADFL